jgi:hypothetical protein
MELQTYDSALEVYRQDLSEHPHNIWSLFGIQQALAMMGESDPVIDKDLFEALNYADIWMPSTKY